MTGTLALIGGGEFAATAAVDPELLEVFRGFYARRKGEFVIESDSPPPPFDAPYGTYRCMEEMRALIGWLRGKGVKSKTPLRSLRKEFGSCINCSTAPAAIPNSPRPDWPFWAMRAASSPASTC